MSSRYEYKRRTVNKTSLAESLFVELIQVALGNRKHLSCIPSEREWNGIYGKAMQQTLLGITFEGIEKIPREQWPPLELKYKWIGICNKIRQKNLVINKRCVELSHIFASQGFHSCILKGQGNAQMYPNPLYRTPGDIDIWVEGNRRRITEMVLKKFPNVKEQYHHIDFPIFKDVNVEIHYRPSWQIIPIYNRRIQKYYLSQRNVQCNHVCRNLDENGDVNTPTRDFNLIFQLSHIMSHFFSEGVGLRQFIDYYYLLKQDFTEIERKEYADNLKRFGMKKFAASVMWLMRQVLDLDERYLLVEPYRRGGELLYEEIMATGNFGQYDNRFTKHCLGRITTTGSIIAKNLKLMSTFPLEAFWSPIMLLLNVYRKK